MRPRTGVCRGACVVYVPCGTSVQPASAYSASVKMRCGDDDEREGLRSTVMENPPCEMSVRAVLGVNAARRSRGFSSARSQSVGV